MTMKPVTLAQLQQVLDHWEATGAPVALADESPATPELSALQDLGEQVYGRRPAADVLRQACAALVPATQEVTPEVPPVAPATGWWARQARRLALRHQCRLPLGFAVSTWGEPGLQACVTTGTGTLLTLWGAGGLVALLPMAVIGTPGWVLSGIGLVFTGVLAKGLLSFLTARGLTDLALRTPPGAPRSDLWALYGHAIEANLAQEAAAES